MGIGGAFRNAVSMQTFHISRFTTRFCLREPHFFLVGIVKLGCDHESRLHNKQGN